jgi:hypothetical protein
MHSLSREPLTATRNGKLFWSPKEPGIKPVPIPGADWDPELLMLIEVRPTKTGIRCHAGFARFTNLPVSARHKGV